MRDSFELDWGLSAGLSIWEIDEYNETDQPVWRACGPNAYVALLDGGDDGAYCPISRTDPNVLSLFPISNELSLASMRNKRTRSAYACGIFSHTIPSANGVSTAALLRLCQSNRETMRRAVPTTTPIMIPRRAGRAS